MTKLGERELEEPRKDAIDNNKKEVKKNIENRPLYAEGSTLGILCRNLSILASTISSAAVS